MSIKLGDFNILEMKVDGQTIYNYNEEKNILVPTKENITNTISCINMRELTK